MVELYLSLEKTKTFIKSIKHFVGFRNLIKLNIYFENCIFAFFFLFQISHDELNANSLLVHLGIESNHALWYTWKSLIEIQIKDITFFFLSFKSSEIFFKKTYRSKMRASFKTLPKLMYASKKFGSNVTAFSKWWIANQISPWALNTHPKLLHATAKSGRVSMAFK